MMHFITSLQAEVDERIHAIEAGEKNILKRALAASDMLEVIFGQLKEFINRYVFPSEEDEIRFFKEVKPRIFCYLLYYRKVYNIEMNLPMGTEQERTRYLDGELDVIQQFIAKRLDFYRYMRSGATHLDRQYFLRGESNARLQYLDSFYFERDPTFSTPGDFRVAKILANDMLQLYLREELEKIRLNRFTLCETPEVRLDTPRWTGPKAGLYEILHSISAMGSVDNGDISVNRLVQHFERMFDIRLGNPSRALNEMKFRKNPTEHLDRMKEALQKKMDDSEEAVMEKNLKRNAIEKKDKK